MRVRAAAVLIRDGAIALMERHKGGRHYFAFPGGGVDDGETPEGAVIREVFEELGLAVRVVRPIAEVWLDGSRQIHYLVEEVGGEFGTGQGSEYSPHRLAHHGTYQPVWMRVDDIPVHLVLPHAVAELVVRSSLSGWPEGIVVVHEARR